MVLRALLRHSARLCLTLLLAGLLGATLARFAPAFGVDEADLDPRLGRRVESHRPDALAVLQFYGHYLKRIAVGEFGESPSMQRPIGELLRERLPVSLRSLVIGVGMALATGFGFALLTTAFRSPHVRAVPITASALLLSLPSAGLALLFVILGWPPPIALAALIFPRVYRYCSAALETIADAPHVAAARARGLGASRIWTTHIIRVGGPQLLAVAGVAISIGFPSLVPIEAVCDSPGALQLAWKAALARDMPLLVTMTMVASVIVLLGNAAADFSAERCRRAA